MSDSLRTKCFYRSCVDYNQDHSLNSNTPGPQDGGFDTSAWGNYNNYYPIQNQSNNNNNNNNSNQPSRADQRSRPSSQRQQTSNNSVVVCCCPWKQ
jgi:hypothetical protein